MIILVRASTLKLLCCFDMCVCVCVHYTWTYMYKVSGTHILWGLQNRLRQQDRPNRTILCALSPAKAC